jgi:hypothetical protein
VLAALDRNLDVKVASTLDTEYIPKVKQLCEKMNQTTFSGNLSVISTNLNSCLSNFTLVKRDLELTNDWPRSAQESLMALSKTTASLEQTFGERVASAINSYFQGVLRFPLVKEAPNAPMSLADLRRFTNEVTQSTGWLGQVASRHPRVASAASFQQLQSGLSSLLTLANILQTPTNRAVFTISNLRSRDFQSIKLRGATGGADGEPLRNGADHLLGNIALYDKPIFEFDNAPLSINAEWGAIQYYLEAQNRIFKMKPTGSTSPIDIMVTVPDGLPAPSKWPAKDDFASWHW